MSEAPLTVVVVGRDAALWLAAVSLQRALGVTGVAVTVVELPASLHPGAVQRSLPPLEALHNRLGLNEADLIRATGGSYTLGWNISPPPPAEPFFLAHGGYGAPIDGADLFHHWVKARRFGLDVAFEMFSPTAMAARQGRMLLPDSETEKFGRTDYGYHLPGIAYAGFLKGLAHRAKLTSHRSRSVVVERDEADGAIRAVKLDQGERIEGDLFVDASGAEAVLIGGALGQGLEACATGSAVDRTLVASAPRFASVPVYSEVRICEGGWLELLASQAATQVKFAYSSTDRSDEAALAEARSASQLPLQQARATAVQAGDRPRPWTANCIAIGGAAHAFDPLFDLDLHIVQLGIVHLISLFPSGNRFDAERDEFNRVLGSNIARLRDLQPAFYGLNRFHAAGFWDTVRRAGAPETTLHKIATFRARGQIPPMEDESFAPDFWRALLVGLGEMPQTWPPAIDLTSAEALKSALQRMLGFVKNKVLQQPTHDAYLARLAQGELV
ncbi:MAG TPA: tryptophan 7-halogenase [Caulobacteraceae bacterium]